MPWPARRVAATRAASCVRLKRDTPSVAPRREATRRARSSAAPRLVATIVTGWCAGKRSRNAAARSSRTAADEDSTIENGRDCIALPRTLCRVSDTAVPHCRAGEDITASYLLPPTSYLLCYHPPHEARAHLHSPLARRRALPDFSPLVPVCHRHHVLGLSGRAAGGSRLAC